MFGIARRIFGRRTLDGIAFDLRRLRTRLRRHRRGQWPELLHLGAGARRVPGWLNVDVSDSDCDVDLASGVLPWPDGTFSAVVSQHFIEHIEMDELVKLLMEVRRVLRPGGEVWLSCPDIEKVCRGYLADRGAALMAHRRGLWPEGCPTDDTPSQHVLNLVFHQWGQHKNLYDFELLAWVTGRAGFRSCERITERDLLKRFPGFPERRDDLNTLYVLARP
jgi:predicted SAM-dependent methyltransferase